MGESYLPDASKSVLSDFMLRGAGFGREAFLNGFVEAAMDFGRKDGESGELAPKKFSRFLTRLDGESKLIVSAWN